MDMIMALLTNITRDMEIIKKTLERMSDNAKLGTLVKKVEPSCSSAATVDRDISDISSALPG